MRGLRKRVDQNPFEDEGAPGRVGVEGIDEVREPEPAPSFPVPVPWKVEQLNAMGPMTGPSHRTFVPIVRSTMKDNSVPEVAESPLGPQL